MKGSDKLEMTINIAGEFIELQTDFAEQGDVREAEYAVKQYCTKLKRQWPDYSDRQIMAMALYHFARSYRDLLKIQEKALDLAYLDTNLIDASLNSDMN